MFKNVRRGLKEFDSSFSIAEKLYQTINFLLIVGGGTSVAGIVAWLDPYINKLGVFGFFVIFIVASFFIFSSMLLYKMTVLSTTKQKYYYNLTQQKTSINPLSEVYTDEVIYLEDLRLPLNKPQTNKTFRKCRLVGPMAILVMNGSIHNSSFNECGQFISLPEGCASVHLEGVLQFVSCHFYECTFIQATIITPFHVSISVKRDMPGVPYIGLD